MKYICRLFANDPNAKCGNTYGGDGGCKHGKPHEWVEETIALSAADYCFNRDIETECDCIPVPFEMIMKEVIKKHEEEK